MILSVQMRKLLLVFLLTGGCLQHNANAVENYLFYGAQPLAVVSANGDISPFSLNVNERGKVELDKRLARKLQTLWAYAPGYPPTQVAATIKPGYVGCDQGVVVETAGQENGLLMLKRLPVHFPAVSEDAGRIEQAKRLLAELLRKQNVSARWLARLLDRAVISEVSLFAREKKSLVISVQDEWKNRTITALLIVSPDARGKDVVTMERLMTGGPSDSDGFAGQDEFILFADLNGDGVAEFLLGHKGYETFGSFLYRWSGKAWIEVAQQSGGC